MFLVSSFSVEVLTTLALAEKAQRVRESVLLGAGRNTPAAEGRSTLTPANQESER